MIRHLIGKMGLVYALNTPEHRGKFRILRLLDALLGPFQLENTVEKIQLSVYLSSLMDVSYFRIARKPDAGPEVQIDEIAPKLIKNLRSGDLFIDIGANIGFLSLMASRRVGPDGLVIAIEPSNREYSRLLNNVAKNHVVNVLPVHAALGDTAGIAALEIAQYHTGLNRLSNSNQIVGQRAKVAAFKGSELLALLLSNRKAALVKIDVEGAEVMVLRGLRSYLMEYVPENVVVEITPRFLAYFGSSKRELYELMAEVGYKPMLNLDIKQYDEIFRPVKSCA